jgi:hypothetical protein
MSDLVDINDSISSTRGVDNNDDADYNNDDNDEDTINNGRGTAIPKRQGLRQGQGQLRRFGNNGGNNGDCGKGDCNGWGNNKEEDMVMRQGHNNMPGQRQQQQ